MEDETIQRFWRHVEKGRRLLALDPSPPELALEFTIRDPLRLFARGRRAT